MKIDRLLNSSENNSIIQEQEAKPSVFVLDDPREDFVPLMIQRLNPQPENSIPLGGRVDVLHNSSEITGEHCEDTALRVSQAVKKERKNASNKKYRETHKQEIKAYNQLYNTTHQEEKKIKSARYYQKHIVEREAKKAANRAMHKDEINAKQREDRRLKREAAGQMNPQAPKKIKPIPSLEEIREAKAKKKEYMKKYKEANREEINQKAKERRDALKIYKDPSAQKPLSPAPIPQEPIYYNVKLNFSFPQSN